jgi:hypothetical protein
MKCSRKQNEPSEILRSDFNLSWMIPLALKERWNPVENYLFHFEELPPNVEAKWLAHLLRIREISGSNLDPETGYPEDFRGFLQSLHENAG